jgi:hypothetical protein
MSVRFEATTTFSVPSWKRTLACAAAGAAGVLGTFAPGIESHIGTPAALTALLGGLVTIVLALIAFGRRPRHQGVARVDDERIELRASGKPPIVLPRSLVRSAYFAPGAGHIPAVVRLLGDNDRLLAEVGVGGASEAQRLLDTLHLGPSQRSARFEAWSPRRSVAAKAAWGSVALGVGLTVAATPLHAPLLILAGFLVMLATSLFLVRCTIHVGADGLLVATRIAPRFIPWSDVVSVQYDGLGIVVHLANEAVRIPLSNRRRDNDYDRVTQEALLTRAQQALAAFRSGREPDAATRVARAGRSHEDWVRALFDREGTFRTAPILDDQLWSVVESPHAEVTARAGAATVLARGAGELERSRLRVAADACTAPRLRVLLERTASGASEEELDGALRELEEEDDGREKDRASHR